MDKILVIAGSGEYPRRIVLGAKAAGVGQVDVMAVKGSCEWATARLGDHVFKFAAGESDKAIAWAAQGYDGAVLAGQVRPMSLFCGTFDQTVRNWLREMPVKSAHSIFGKLVAEFERSGVKMLPASSYLDECLPDAGVLTARGLSDVERSDVCRGFEVAADVGRHDVGQTVLVKSGMVLAVEAFEGTNAAIRRAGKLGRGSVLVKAARDGHDWRFDIPVVGIKTLKVMRRAGVTALAFQAKRLVLFDRDEVIRFANRHSMAIVGVPTLLPPAPTRP